MIKRLLLFSFLSTLITFAQDTSQTFITLKSTGVEEFLNTNPDYNGKGTIIFILDTGVDIGIDGLTSTPNGEVKVIDVQDFTGQGDVKLFEAYTDEDNEIIYIKNDERKLSIKGLERIKLKASDNKYLIGSFDERRFINSNAGIKDLNGNGKTDDDFIVVVFPVTENNETYWNAYFDTNADGSIGDENPIRSYAEKYDTFHILNPTRIPDFTFAINIFPDKKLLNVFFDDGGHGSHVAGIASGCKIGREDHFNGVAPGSNLIALKIGLNTLSGGASNTGSIRKAFLYADSLSKIKKEPCIVNMSYGIGSVIEGQSDLELFLDNLLKNNPYLYVCVSNGNSGPGISTAGLPSSSEYVFSSGAVLTTDIARDLYGAVLDEDIILHFSSRGGEVPKPDVCSPGAAVSTVTNWSSKDISWGTSMASPYSAGVMSLLLSAVNQKYPDVKIPSGLLFKAVKYSASKMKGYNLLDQGGGLINVVNAFNMLEQFIKNNEYENYSDYKVSSFAPNMPFNKAPNLYIRNGLFLDSSSTYSFNISRVKTNPKQKFYRIYNLVSDDDWLIPIQKKIHIRDDQNISVSVLFNKSKMKEPGLYTAKITANRADKTKFPEFELTAAVIIPYEFNSENGYSGSWKNEKLKPGELKRYFIDIPAGAGSMTIRMNSDKNEYTQTVYRIFNPDGENIYSSYVFTSEEEENENVKTLYNMNPGIYEIVVHGYYLSKSVSEYNLSVDFSGIRTVNQSIVLKPGETKIELFNHFNQVKNFKLSGQISGYKKEVELKFTSNKYVYPFVIRKNENSKTFQISMSKIDYNKVTDFSLIIFDKNNVAQVKNSLEYASGEITINNILGEDSTFLFLELEPAFLEKPENIIVYLTELTKTTPEDIQVYHNNIHRIDLYPSVQESVVCNVKNPAFYVPVDSHPYGIITLINNHSDRKESEIPFIVKNEGEK